MGVITPPVGINVYVIKGITSGISLETIFKGIFPFLIAIIVCVAILLAFPQIATFLPGIATY
jgi:TRAP-type C4-dicarboxylate transport system permease large subunit